VILFVDKHVYVREHCGNAGRALVLRKRVWVVVEEECEELVVRRHTTQFGDDGLHLLPVRGVAPCDVGVLHGARVGAVSLAERTVDVQR